MQRCDRVSADSTSDAFATRFRHVLPHDRSAPLVTRQSARGTPALSPPAHRGSNNSFLVPTGGLRSMLPTQPAGSTGERDLPAVKRTAAPTAPARSEATRMPTLAASLASGSSKARLAMKIETVKPMSARALTPPRWRQFMPSGSADWGVQLPEPFVEGSERVLDPRRRDGGVLALLDQAVKLEAAQRPLRKRTGDERGPLVGDAVEGLTGRA